MTSTSTEGVTDFLNRMEQEAVLVADQDPFVELWERDFKRLLALARTTHSRWSEK